MQWHMWLLSFPIVPTLGPQRSTEYILGFSLFLALLLQHIDRSYIEFQVSSVKNLNQFIHAEPTLMSSENFPMGQPLSSV